MAGNVYTRILMVQKEDIENALNKLILSASGWRGIFAAPDLSGANGDEEAKSEEISAPNRIICAAAALNFAEYLKNRGFSKKPVVLLGRDTRPTGKAIAEAMIPVLLSSGCEVRYASFTASPEIMAWARNTASSGTTVSGAEQHDHCKADESDHSHAKGFIYISASHNPIGHNGLKFGLTDGGVLAAEESVKLIENFRNFFKKDYCVEKIEKLLSAAEPAHLKNVYDKIEEAKLEALNAYYNFCGDVVWGGSSAVAAAVEDGLSKKPLGIVCDFNGSARTVSIDRGFFPALGLNFEFINGEPGQIAHRIVPEGESLEPCRALLEETHKRDASFLLGYVPDCDGDRGNLVIWDDAVNKAHTLEAQEVFALAVVAELTHLVWTGELSYDSEGKAITKAAVAINDPTSMRIDRIAEAFGVDIFRAEVGEANVVSLARKLREQGYLVRILGEGSAGGNITHPSAVRDPLHTVMALVKLLSIRSSAETHSIPHSPLPTPHCGLFEIWLRRSGQIDKYREDFTLADIIASLPKFNSTPAYSKDAVLQIKTKDHAILKDRYQKIFMREWEERKERLKAQYGICGWEAIAYNGTEEKRGLTRFGEAGRGGLKVLFTDSEGKAAAKVIAYIWMRGSATEPVFRIMADVQGAKEFENDLLNWQKSMIMEADKE